MILIAVVVGGAVGWLGPGRARLRGLERLGQVRKGMPWGLQVSDETRRVSIGVVEAKARQQVSSSLAAELAGQGPVLLLPEPDNREKHLEELAPSLADVWLMETVRPSPAQVLEAVKKLAGDGRSPVMVVEGALALEAPPADRPAATLEELLESSRVPVLVLASEEEPLPDGRWPVFRLGGEPGALSSDKGPCLWARGGRLEAGDP